MNQESEKTLEARLQREIKKRGGMALKLLSQLHRGLPDRLVLLPTGWTIFVEMKSTGKKPTRLQEHCHQQLAKMNFPVFVIDSSDGLDELLSHIDLGLGEADPEKI